MHIPTPFRDAAALFAEGGPHPYLWLDGRYLVATDRVQMIVLRLDEEHTGPAVALPFDIGTDMTIMDGLIMSELGLHIAPSDAFPDWRRVYQRTTRSEADTMSDAPLLGRLLLANEVLGGGQILMQSGAQWQSKFSIGNGKAHVFWMPFTPLAHVDAWDVRAGAKKVDEFDEIADSLSLSVPKWLINRMGKEIHDAVIQEAKDRLRRPR